MKVLEERAETHGDFAQGAIACQTLKSMFSTDDMVSKEAVDNIIQKLVRIKFGHRLNIDSWRDIAGYAKLGGDRCKTTSSTLITEQPEMLFTCDDEDVCPIINILLKMATDGYSKELFFMIVGEALAKVKVLETTPGAIDVECKKKEIK